MTDSTSINKNVAYTSIARFFALIFTLIYSILLVRLLGAEGNGVFSFLVANALVAISFLGLRVNSGLSYFLAKGNLPKEKVLGFTILILGIATILTVGISLILFGQKAHILSFLLPLGYQEFFFLLFFLFSFLAQAVVQFCSAIAIGNLFYRNINQYTFFSSLAKFVLILAYYLGSQFNLLENKLEMLFLLILGVEIISAVLFLIFLWARTQFKVDFRFPFHQFIKPFMIYSLKSWTLGFLGFFSGRFFTWVVTFYRGLKPLGILALAVSLFTNAQMFFNPIYLALGPYLIRLPEDEGKEKFLFFMRITITISIFFSIATFVLSPYFIPLIFGEEFQATVRVTQIIFLAMPFWCLRGLAVNYSSSQNKHQYMIFAEVVVFTFTIIGDLLFIPQYGIIGAAWVMFIGFFISACITTYFLIKKMKLPVLNNLFISWKDVMYVWQILRSKIRQLLSSSY